MRENVDWGIDAMFDVEDHWLNRKDPQNILRCTWIMFLVSKFPSTPRRKVEKSAEYLGHSINFLRKSTRPPPPQLSLREFLFEFKLIMWKSKSNEKFINKEKWKKIFDGEVWFWISIRKGYISSSSPPPTPPPSPFLSLSSRHSLKLGFETWRPHFVWGFEEGAVERGRTRGQTRGCKFFYLRSGSNLSIPFLKIPRMELPLHTTAPEKICATSSCRYRYLALPLATLGP